MAMIYAMKMVHRVHAETGDTSKISLAISICKIIESNSEQLDNLNSSFIPQFPISRGPTRYTRKWEDESAYAKQTIAPVRNPRPEDFPELGSRADRRSRNVPPPPPPEREEKENRARQNQQIEEENRSAMHQKRISNRPQLDRDERSQRPSNHSSGKNLMTIELHSSMGLIRLRWKVPSHSEKAL